VIPQAVVSARILDDVLPAKPIRKDVFIGKAATGRAAIDAAAEAGVTGVHVRHSIPLGFSAACCGRELPDV